jgi:hypothetical protein
MTRFGDMARHHHGLVTLRRSWPDSLLVAMMRSPSIAQQLRFTFAFSAESPDDARPAGASSRWQGIPELSQCRRPQDRP